MFSKLAIVYHIKFVTDVFLMKLIEGGVLLIYFLS